MKLLDIIIPTFNNVHQLLQCLNSIQLGTFGQNRELMRFIIVNNGHDDLKNYIVESENLILLQPGVNLGWEGGLKLGLKHSDAPFVAFSNDDIRFVEGQKFWLWKMLSMFSDPNVAAVGPSSNYVMGLQSIFHDSEYTQLAVKYLIGFFFMVRRSALDEAGGVDDTLPGGDDIDLSIRLRDLGKTLICKRDVFVYHHGSQTGAVVHRGYWNSPQMQEKTNHALIRKHGMLKFWDTMVAGWAAQVEYSTPFINADVEGDLCRQHIGGEGNVVELGCGAVKTVPYAVGVDLRPKGEKIAFVAQDNNKSVAEIHADVSLELPFDEASQDCLIARHILEHCQDTLGTLKVWNRVLKEGGKLVVAVPNHELANTIVMHPEHVTAFTPDSLANLARVCGFEMEVVYPNANGVSLVAVFKKVADAHWALNAPKPTTAPAAARLVYA